MLEISSMISKAYKLAILSLFAMILLFVYSSNDVVSANSVESNMDNVEYVNNEVSNVIQKIFELLSIWMGQLKCISKIKMR